MSDLDRNKLNEFPAFNVALGKILIAAAWVDGEINEEELICLKNLILQFPKINFEDWRKLKIYIAYPICKAEQDSISKNFIEQVYLSEHRQRAWGAIISVLRSDGRINIEEKKFAEEIDNALAENAESFLRKLKFFLFQNTIKDTNPWKNESNSRDRFIHEFFDNPVYFLFRKALLNDDIKVPHSKPELQKICLYSAILCWLASVDENITFPELRSIRRILTDTCGLSPEVAKCIQQVSFAIDINDLQLNELVRALRGVTNKVERNELFLALCKLVIVDKHLSDRELECLRIIALYLEISRQIWVDALNEIVLKTFK